MTTFVSCSPAQTINPEAAQQAIANSLQSRQHAVWELDWPNAPIGGPLTVKTWQSDNRYRHEILEATAPALIGQTLVFDGQTGWQYNRLSPPESFSPVEPQLSPITDVLAIINQLLDTTPSTATQQTTNLNSVPVQKFSLSFANGDSLTAWLDETTGLPRKIEFSAGKQQGTIEARSVEKLVNPPPELFTVGEWAQNQ